MGTVAHGFPNRGPEWKHFVLKICEVNLRPEAAVGSDCSQKTQVKSTSELLLPSDVSPDRAYRKKFLGSKSFFKERKVRVIVIISLGCNNFVSLNYILMCLISLGLTVKGNVIDEKISYKSSISNFTPSFLF